MRIDTIVTDLDDTLFDGTGKISPFTLKVMHRCKERGIRIIPASGRIQASMEPYVRQLDTRMPYIGCNGAQIVNADHTLMENLTLPMTVALEVCDFFRERDCYAQVYRGEYIYYAEDNSYSENYKRSSGLKAKAVGDLRAFLDFLTPKILCIAEPETVAALYPVVQSRFAGRAEFTISKPIFLEVEPLGANKGAALKRLAPRMNILPEKTFVFGDSLNDLSMLAFTKNSVAMGNARDEVKQATTYVCEPNTGDGLARFVLEHLLQESLS